MQDAVMWFYMCHVFPFLLKLESTHALAHTRLYFVFPGCDLGF